MNAIVSTVGPRSAFGKKKKKMSEEPNTTQCQKIHLKMMNDKQYLLTFKLAISKWNQCRCILSCGSVVSLHKTEWGDETDQTNHSNIPIEWNTRCMVRELFNMKNG